MAQLFVVGTGLIGASFALAARRSGSFDRVVGLDHDASAARRAKRLGVIDSVTSSIARGVRDADATVIAVPTGAIAALVREVVAAQAEPRPIFDVGSVKTRILDTLRNGAELPAQFVPCHPLAGSESQGAGGADAGLFRGRRVIITPHEHSSPKWLEQVAGWWRGCGAEVTLADAESHDRAVALTSHLPHLVAFAFMAHAADRADEMAHFAGPGFRDFTRIAGSDPEVWRHILIDNRAAVIDELDGVVERLVAMRSLIERKRSDALERALREGRDGRAQYLEHQ